MNAINFFKLRVRYVNHMMINRYFKIYRQPYSMVLILKEKANLTQMKAHNQEFLQPFKKENPHQAPAHKPIHLMLKINKNSYLISA